VLGVGATRGNLRGDRGESTQIPLPIPHTIMMDQVFLDVLDKKGFSDGLCSKIIFHDSVPKETQPGEREFMDILRKALIQVCMRFRPSAHSLDLEHGTTQEDCTMIRRIFNQRACILPKVNGNLCTTPVQGWGVQPR